MRLIVIIQIISRMIAVSALEGRNANSLLSSQCQAVKLIEAEEAFVAAQL